LALTAFLCCHAEIDCSNKGCQHGCIQLKVSDAPTCVCRCNYSLSADGKSCSAVKQCKNEILVVVNMGSTFDQVNCDNKLYNTAYNFTKWPKYVSDTSSTVRKIFDVYSAVKATLNTTRIGIIDYYGSSQVKVLKPYTGAQTFTEILASYNSPSRNQPNCDGFGDFGTDVTWMLQRDSRQKGPTDFYPLSESPVKTVFILAPYYTQRSLANTKTSISTHADAVFIIPYLPVVNDLASSKYGAEPTNYFKFQACGTSSSQPCSNVMTFTDFSTKTVNDLVAKVPKDACLTTLPKLRFDAKPDTGLQSTTFSKCRLYGLTCLQMTFRSSGLPDICFLSKNQTSDSLDVQVPLLIDSTKATVGVSSTGTPTIVLSTVVVNLPAGGANTFKLPLFSEKLSAEFDSYLYKYSYTGVFKRVDTTGEFFTGEFNIYSDSQFSTLLPSGSTINLASKIYIEYKSTTLPASLFIKTWGLQSYKVDDVNSEDGHIYIMLKGEREEYCTGCEVISEADKQARFRDKVMDYIVQYKKKPAEKLPIQYKIVVSQCMTTDRHKYCTPKRVKGRRKRRSLGNEVEGHGEIGSEELSYVANAAAGGRVGGANGIIVDMISTHQETMSLGENLFLLYLWFLVVYVKAARGGKSLSEGDVKAT